MCEHHNFRPVRAPWSPSSRYQDLAPLVTHVNREFLFRFSSGGFFLRFRGLPKPSASASRLPNTGTSLATLLSFANAVVTRRRVQVYTLPLSAPGSLSAPWPPSILRQAPIAVEHSRLFLTSATPSYLGTFSTRVRRQFRRWLSPGFPLPSRFRLATPRLILWAFSHTLRRCDSALSKV